MWCCRVEPERDRVRIKLWLPYLHMTSDYKLEGRILMLPISGNGFSEGNYSKFFNLILYENNIKLKFMCLLFCESVKSQPYSVSEFGILEIHSNIIYQFYFIIFKLDFFCLCMSLHSVRYPRQLKNGKS